MLRVAVVLCLSLAAASAQQADPAWERLRALPAGAALRVHQRSRDVAEGRLVRWTQSELVLHKSAIARPEIAKVSRRSRWKGALIGFAAGFAIGFPIGIASAGNLSDRNNPSTGVRMGFGAGFGLFSGGIGAGIGALTGAHRTVYRAP